MKKVTKKVIAVLITIILIIPMFNTVAFAADDDADGAAGLQFITDLAIGTDDAIALLTVPNEMKKKGYSIVQYQFNGSDGNFDFNSGAHGDYIFLGYKAVSDFAANVGKMITGLLVCVNCHPEHFDWDGKTYYPVSNSVGVTNCDLNNSVGGDYLYLYYTCDDAEKGAPVLRGMTGTKSFESSQTSADYVCGVYEDSDGFHGLGCLDMNKGVSGAKYIYLSAYYHTHKTTMHSDADGHWEACSECSYVSAKESHDGYWKEGVCEKCSYKCLHTGETGVFCSVCGMYLGNHVCQEGKYLDYDPSKEMLVYKDIPQETTEITAAGTYAGGYYILKGTKNIDGQLTFTGDAHVILADGADIQTKGIAMKNTSSLAIYAQSNMGSEGLLTVKDVPENFAGIGTGPDDSCAGITINGGCIDVSGGAYASGIGAGKNSAVGSVTVNGGVIKANKGADGSYHIGNTSGNVTCGKNIKFISREENEYRTVNCSYYPKLEPTCTTIGHEAYFKNTADGFYYSTMPFNEVSRVPGNDPRNELSIPRIPHSFVFIDESTHKCSVCGFDADHSYDESGNCSCDLSATGSDDRLFRYCDAHGEWHNVHLPENVELKEITKAGEYAGGWYMIKNSLSLSDRIIFKGDAHLILKDGTVTTCTGISLKPGVSITIFAQSENTGRTGKLNIPGNKAGSAGIGAEPGEYTDPRTCCGNITIHGGDISAAGGSSGCAGIGGSQHVGCGNITIYGGKVTATGYGYGAGIGGGTYGDCKDITINGGTVTGNSTGEGAGIGGGLLSSYNSITINGGKVTGIGFKDSAGIGCGGWYIDCGGITINGGEVTAVSNENGGFVGAAAIGCGYENSCGDIRFNGGVVKATSNTRRPAISTGSDDSFTLISRNLAAYELNGDTPVYEINDRSLLSKYKSVLVRETIPDFEPSIYITYGGNGEEIHNILPKSVKEITAPGEYAGGWYILKGTKNLGGQIIFTGDAHLVLGDYANIEATGILMGEDVSLNLYGQNVNQGVAGKLTVRNAPSHYAGIGADEAAGKCGNITIHSGEYDIKGGEYAAGIGGGYTGSTGNITINGGFVTSKGGYGGAGIGGGYRGINGVVTPDEQGFLYVKGSITINGGIVKATGGDQGPGIGASCASGGCTAVINGGFVSATGGTGCPGIGAGYYRSSNKFKGVTINGGTVEAQGGEQQPGIGGGCGGSCDVVTINGGLVTAVSGGTPSGAIGNGFYYIVGASNPEGQSGKLGSIKLGKGVYGLGWNGSTTYGTWLTSFDQFNRISGVQVVKLNAGSPSEYVIISGADSKWVKGSGKVLTVTCSGPFEEFISPCVDENIVDERFYEASSGSTVLKLKSEYLETLEPGEHTLSFVYRNGAVVSTTLTIIEETETPPETGDQSAFMLWIALLLISGSAFVGLTVYKKKNVK